MATSQPAPSSSPILRIHDGRAAEKAAVRALDLEIDSGDVFAFLGPNGAGKSKVRGPLRLSRFVFSELDYLLATRVGVEPDPRISRSLAYSRETCGMAVIRDSRRDAYKLVAFGSSGGNLKTGG